MRAIPPPLLFKMFAFTLTNKANLPSLCSPRRHWQWHDHCGGTSQCLTLGPCGHTLWGRICRCVLSVKTVRNKIRTLVYAGEACFEKGQFKHNSELHLYISDHKQTKRWIQKEFIYMWQPAERIRSKDEMAESTTCFAKLFNNLWFFFLHFRIGKCIYRNQNKPNVQAFADLIT